MTGDSRVHNLIAGNIFGEIGNQLRRRPCEAYMEGMRVRTPAGLFTYPDVVVVCGQPRFGDSELDTLLNPTLIVEVLSPSTEAYNRGTKAKQYGSIPSLKEHILVTQSRIRVEQWSRDGGDEWRQRELDQLSESLELQSIHCKLLLADVYERVFG